MDNMVSISQDTYDNLLEAEAFLRALESAGVQDWEGYSQAEEIFDDLNTVDVVDENDTVH